MKILLVFSFPIRIGGSFKSALAMAKYLSRQGHQFSIAAPDGAPEMIKAFQEQGCMFTQISELAKRSPFPISAGWQSVAKLADEQQADIIHAMEFQGIPRGWKAAIAAKKGLVYTAAGGRFPHHVPPRNIDTILFSDEQKDLFTKLYSPSGSNLHLIRERLDTEVYHPEEVGRNFIDKYNLPEDGKRVVMAMRLVRSKTAWLKCIQKSAEHLAQKESRLRIIIAGEGPLLEEMKTMARRINSESRSGDILYMIGPVLGQESMRQLYNYGDLVLGSGRGILEAMACGKPVMILGEKGQGQLISPDTVSTAAYTNFSGRHFRHQPPPTQTVAQILETLLSSPADMQKLGQFSLQYIRTEMAATIGAEKLARVYQKALSTKTSLADYRRWRMQAAIAKLRFIGPELKRRLMPKRLS